MQNIDIPFPETDYEVVGQLDRFKLIYPYDHSFAQAVKIDTVIRVLSFSDGDYGELLSSSFKDTNYKPIDTRIMNIDYIRDCSLYGVTSKEWSENYGPKNPKQFLKYIKGSTRDGFVRIVSLSSPHYSLKLFNTLYQDEI